MKLLTLYKIRIRVSQLFRRGNTPRVMTLGRYQNEKSIKCLDENRKGNEENVNNTEG